MASANITRAEAEHRSSVVKTNAYRVLVDVTGNNLADAGVNFATQTEIGLESYGGTTHLDLIADEVIEAWLDENPLDVSGYDGFRLPLPELAAGHHQLKVSSIGRYSNSGEGLHRFHDPADGKVYLYSQFESADARRMYATFEQPDQKATFQLSVIAPAHWRVFSNSATPQPSDVSEGVARWDFANTPAIATYITALVAGDYHVVEGEIRSQKGTIPASVVCRQSVAQYLDADRILQTAQSGFEFFEASFGVAYAFDSYDQIFVPEFNFGAMENVGCVTFRDEYLFRSRVTAREMNSRDNTILHELAHMWFGDLVTMRWWDDLWLNESFAEWASHFAAANINASDDAFAPTPWSAFSNERKGWAYVQDQYPTTHPIAADMSDLEKVEQNFDGITYAKGASVLKLLVAFVGQDQFLAGVSNYFKKFAFSNTTLADLLSELETASGKDLSWFTGQWLETSGVNTLRADFETDEDGNFQRFAIQQTAAAGWPTLRTHRLGIGLYNLGGLGLEKVGYLETDISGPTTDIAELVGTAQPDLILPNDQDLTYAEIRFDARSQQTLKDSFAKLGDPLSRAVVWNSLWDSVRNAELAPADYAAIVLANIAIEPDVNAISAALTRARRCVAGLTAPELREESSRQFVAGLANELLRAEPGSDRQLLIAKALIGAASTEKAYTLIQCWLEDVEVPEGMAIDTDVRWAIVHTLAKRGVIGEIDIEAELARDRTSAGAERAAGAAAALPTAEEKADAWRFATEDETVPNETHRSICAGFWQYGQDEVLRPYVDRYFEVVSQISAREAGWANRGYAAVGAVLGSLYPVTLLDEALVERTTRYLAEGEPSQQVQRVLSERLDDAKRALASQALSRRVAAQQ